MKILKDKRILIALTIIVATFVIWQFWLSDVLNLGEIGTQIEDFSDINAIKEYFIKSFTKGTTLSYIIVIVIFCLVGFIIKSKVRPQKEKIKKIIVIATLIISIIQITNFIFEFIKLDNLLEFNEEMHLGMKEAHEQYKEYVKNNKVTKEEKEKSEAVYKQADIQYETNKIILNISRDTLWLMLLEIPMACIPIKLILCKSKEN